MRRSAIDQLIADSGNPLLPTVCTVQVRSEWTTHCLAASGGLVATPWPQSTVEHNFAAFSDAVAFSVGIFPLILIEKNI